MLNRIAFLTLLVAAGVTGQLTADETTAQVSGKVRELHQQRIDVLKIRVRAVEAFVSSQQGDVAPDVLELQFKAAGELIDAQLQIADTPDKTTALLVQAVKQAGQRERIAKTREEHPLTVLLATADHLDAEIRLVKYKESRRESSSETDRLELQQERVKVLQMLEKATQQFVDGQRGDVSPQLFESLMNTKLRFLEAQLAVETEPKKQLAIHLSYLNDAKSYEAWLTARGESAIPILTAQAMRLDAEIRIAQLEAKFSAAK